MGWILDKDSLAETTPRNPLREARAPEVGFPASAVGGFTR